MGLYERNPEFVKCEQQRRRTAYASTQSDQRHCYSIYEKYISQACYMQSFNIVDNPCS